MPRPGLSTVGVTFGYGIEETAGTKPAAFTQLHRINSIGNLGIERDQIDASALEDELTKYIAGRGDTGGNVPVTVNVADETVTEWETLISAYQTAKAAGKGVWFQTITPDLTKAFFFIAEPPTKIPQPSFDQNGLLTIEMPLIVNEYRGLDAKVAF